MLFKYKRYFLWHLVYTTIKSKSYKISSIRETIILYINYFLILSWLNYSWKSLMRRLKSEIYKWRDYWVFWRESIKIDYFTRKKKLYILYELVDHMIRKNVSKAVMKGLNSAIGARSWSARLKVMRPVTCSVPDVSRIGRRRRHPRSLRPGGSQHAEILLQHLDLVLGSFPFPGSIFLGRRWHVEGHVAMMSLQDPG